MRSALAVVVLAVVTVGCGSRRLPSRGVVTRAAPGLETGWARFSDREHHQALFPTRGRIWSVTRTGVVSWDRGTATFRAERGLHAPGPGARWIATAEDGPVHVALPDGLAWKDARGWHRSQIGFLKRGVTTLAPRVGGGVWVAGPGGLGWFHAGRLWQASSRYRVTGLSRGAAGLAWAATDGHGVLALTANAITEHSVDQGLCGQRVRSVATGVDGRVAAVCQDGTFAVYTGNRWTSWRLDGAGPVQRVQPVRGGLALQTPKGWMMASAATPKAVKGAVKTATGPRLSAVEAPKQPIPPLPTPPPPKPAAQDGRPAPVPMPAPIVPPAVVEAPLGVRRAVARGQAVRPGHWRLEPWAAPPAAGTVTASVVEPDRGLWRAEARRGLTWYRRDGQKRFSSRSLVPKEGPVRLAEDPQGRLLWSDALGNAWRWDGQTWLPVPVPGPGRLTSLEIDAIGRTWAVLVVDPPPAPPMVRPAAPGPVALGQPPAPGTAPAVGPPKRPRPRIRVVRTTGTGPFEEVANVAVATDHRVLTGDLTVSPTGTLYLPLFTVDRNNVRRALGLGRIPPDRARLDIWRGQLGYDGEGADGEVVLPDAWVNDTAVAPDGTLYVATNAGLVRRSSTKTVVFDENAFIDSEVILNVVVDRAGHAWVGTFEGLGRLEGDTWSPVRVPGLNGQSIQAMSLGPDGTLWVGTNRGLWTHAKGQWTAQRVDGRVETGPVRGVLADRQGQIWVATVQGLLYRRAGKAW